MDGIDNKGWKITPQVPPKVRCTKIDTHYIHLSALQNIPIEAGTFTVIYG